MKLKLDDAGAAVLQDGKPVYVADDGKEFALDGGHLYGRVRELTQEAATHRRAKEDAVKRLELFGDLDPEVARSAVTTVANLDAKKLVDAGDVEKLKADTIKAIEAKYAPTVARVKDLETELHAEKIGGAFARSKFIADNIAIPADFIEATFGRHFKLEGGKVVAFDSNGNQIYSRSGTMEPASFEEALSILIDGYPNKDAILKGPVGGGGGARSSNPGAAASKTVKASVLEAMSPRDKAAYFADPANKGLQVIDG